ncbi:hypothetical protein EV177_010739, partial [Coemansia sp. RSA 1804]
MHGFYGAGQQTTHPSVPLTPLQQSQYAPLHVQGLAPSQSQIHVQQQQPQPPRHQMQRHSQQQQQQQQNTVASSAQPLSAAATVNASGSGPHHHQKHPQNKTHRKTDA